ncbi:MULTISPECIES: MarR family winged helix-turn-helix transcriptional regulator [Thalassolituus]|jgi:DNA-binding MarR family transcriptional regulator|uniref:MarR family transcriptional regulator n=1 Tax=Thalassolituus hydrocarboniclasticus TaxID=2742796 RepID=A0ABY6A6T7_9GAMM|nr:MULTISPECIES: MarR family transcriptional regulator [Thalassolituus]MAY13818.1 MarR family transcriptional regulator [Oceanospirillaceae bacterium]PIQ41760.1 MAG: MarR family transcriptional regulator [Thalassolituus sp. CG17_big_fil_post_rev_8_21_14_2_50_53_8]MCA6060677.1 MarR family transcriptional regulator [Thalassolituus sp. ST750PaO-4]TVV39440.1 MarR family transcriptional regulator [Thalassolituus sp. C2-1]UXD86345.1 MarR family transcriptional regulator [Thalassolituus hydrocarbonic|tara:strand:+ start:512 stop:925 length:414 start_codon:yes stop_codon:yes gene_type:complete
MDKRLFYLLNSARHRVYKHADQKAEEALGISVTQLGALMLIAANEGCLLKDLAQSLNLNNSALTGLAARMEHNGLIERRACELDGRASRLYLTLLGRSKIDSARPLISQLNAAMTEGFSEQEVLVILRFLNRLLSEF